jgi:hypothetical protein
MDKEPLEAKEVQHLTLDQLLERSLDELRKSLGVPKVIEADKPNQLTTEQQAEIDALIALPEDQIDTSDIPEVTDFTGFQRGLFHTSKPQPCGDHEDKVHAALTEIAKETGAESADKKEGN